MSKVRKIMDEAKESRNPELDLVDKGISSFDEIPNLRKSSFFLIIEILL
jgi:hypothetical protein